MGKHSIENKKMNFGKAFLAIIILVLIVTGVIGAIYAIKNNTDDDVNNNFEFVEQEKVINNAFSALKNADTEEVEKYLNYTELISGIDESIIQEDMKDIERNLFNTMEWSIENIREEDGSTIAIIEVTNKNYKNIITEWLRQVVELKSNTDEVSNQEGLQVLENILKENNSGTESVIKKIKLERQDENWRLIVNNDLISLVYPGIEVINNVL